MNGGKKVILFVTFILIYSYISYHFLFFRCFGKSSFSFLWTLESED